MPMIPSLMLLLLLVVYWLTCRIYGWRATLSAGTLLMFFTFGTVGATLVSLYMQAIPTPWALEQATSYPFGSMNPSAWLSSPAIEEVAKILPCALLVALLPAARRLSVADFTLVAFTTGLGFGFVEDNLSQVVSTDLPSVPWGSLWSFGFGPGNGGEYKTWGDGHWAATALVGLGLGVGVKLWPDRPLKWVPAGLLLVLVTFDHSMWNFKQLHQHPNSVELASAPWEWLYALTGHGFLEIIALPVGLVAAMVAEGRWARRSTHNHAQYLLPGELDGPLAFGEARIAWARARLGPAALLGALTYFRHRRALELAEADAARPRADAASAYFAAEACEQLWQERRLNAEPQPTRWLPQRGTWPATAKRLLMRYRMVALVSLLSILVFTIAPRYLRSLHGHPFGWVVTLLSAAYTAWRIWRFVSAGPPDPARSDSEKLVTHRTRAMLLGSSTIAVAIPLVALAFNKHGLVPGAVVAMLTSRIGDFVGDGGNLETLVAAGGLAAAVAAAGGDDDAQVPVVSSGERQPEDPNFIGDPDFNSAYWRKRAEEALAGANGADAGNDGGDLTTTSSAPGGLLPSVDPNFIGDPDFTPRYAGEGAQDALGGPPPAGPGDGASVGPLPSADNPDGGGGDAGGSPDPSTVLDGGPTEPVPTRVGLGAGPAPGKGNFGPDDILNRPLGEGAPATDSGAGADGPSVKGLETSDTPITVDDQGNPNVPPSEMNYQQLEDYAAARREWAAHQTISLSERGDPNVAPADMSPAQYADYQRLLAGRDAPAPPFAAPGDEQAPQTMERPGTGAPEPQAGRDAANAEPAPTTQERAGTGDADPQGGRDAANAEPAPSGGGSGGASSPAGAAPEPAPTVPAPQPEDSSAGPGAPSPPPVPTAPVKTAEELANDAYVKAEADAAALRGPADPNSPLEVLKRAKAGDASAQEQWAGMKDPGLAATTDSAVQRTLDGASQTLGGAYRALGGMETAKNLPSTLFGTDEPEPLAAKGTVQSGLKLIGDGLIEQGEGQVTNIQNIDKVGDMVTDLATTAEGRDVLVDAARNNVFTESAAEAPKLFAGMTGEELKGHADNLWTSVKNLFGDPDKLQEVAAKGTSNVIGQVVVGKALGGLSEAPEVGVPAVEAPPAAPEAMTPRVEPAPAVPEAPHAPAVEAAAPHAPEAPASASAETVELKPQPATPETIRTADTEVAPASGGPAPASAGEPPQKTIFALEDGTFHEHGGGQVNADGSPFKPAAEAAPIDPKAVTQDVPAAKAPETIRTADTEVAPASGGPAPAAAGEPPPKTIFALEDGTFHEHGGGQVNADGSPFKPAAEAAPVDPKAVTQDVPGGKTSVQTAGDGQPMKDVSQEARQIAGAETQKAPQVQPADAQAPPASGPVTRPLTEPNMPGVQPTGPQPAAEPAGGPSVSEPAAEPAGGPTGSEPAAHPAASPETVERPRAPIDEPGTPGTPTKDLSGDSPGSAPPGGQPPAGDAGRAARASAETVGRPRAGVDEPATPGTPTKDLGGDAPRAGPKDVELPRDAGRPSPDHPGFAPGSENWDPEGLKLKMDLARTSGVYKGSPAAEAAGEAQYQDGLGRLKDAVARDPNYIDKVSDPEVRQYLRDQLQPSNTAGAPSELPTRPLSGPDAPGAPSTQPSPADGSTASEPAARPAAAPETVKHDAFDPKPLVDDPPQAMPAEQRHEVLMKGLDPDHVPEVSPENLARYKEAVANARTDAGGPLGSCEKARMSLEKSLGADVAGTEGKLAGVGDTHQHVVTKEGLTLDPVARQAVKNGLVTDGQLRAKGLTSAVRDGVFTPKQYADFNSLSRGGGPPRLPPRMKIQ